MISVKPGDDSELKVSSMELSRSFKFPSSFSEFVDLVIESGSNAISAVGSLTNQQQPTKNGTGEEVGQI